MTERKTAADARAAALAGDRQRIVAALNEERRGYVQRGLTDRVAEVDAQIVAYGGTPPENPTPATGDSSDAKATSEQDAPASTGDSSDAKATSARK